MNIIWIHGWASNPSVWGDLPAFFPGYTHLFPSFRSEENYRNLFDPIRDIVLSSSSNIVIGWSLGGMLALEAAYFFPERVVMVIGISTCASFIDDNPEKGWNQRVLYNMKRRVISHPEITIETFVENMFSAATSTPWIQRYKTEIFMGDPLTNCDFSITSLQAGLDYLIKKNVFSCIQKLDQPIYFLHGTKDRICPLGGFLSLQKKLTSKKNITFTMIPEGDHGMIFSQQQCILSMIGKLLPAENSWQSG